MNINLTIENSPDTFETWINKDFISEDLKQDLRKAAILLVPTIGFREENQPTFPVLTDELYNYLIENLPENCLVELCIDDANYLEIALHSNYKRIGNFVVKEMMLTIFLGVLTSYIYDKYIKPEEAKPQINIINVDNSIHNTVVLPNEPKKTTPKKYLTPAKVRFSVTVVDTNGTSKEYKYEGPAKDVKTVTEEIKDLWNNDKK